jgi:hypothetical protein
MEDNIVIICIVDTNAEVFDKHLQSANPKLEILERRDDNECISYTIKVNDLSALYWLGREYQDEITKRVYKII